MVRWQHAPPRFYRVHITDTETMEELIADCAAIPAPPQPADQYLPGTPTPWTVDEACYAQVDQLDEYV